MSGMKRSTNKRIQHLARHRGRSPLLTIDVLTLFPAMFKGPLDESMLKLAQARNFISIRVHNLRRFALDRHRTCDDKPFGGGPGMVMKPEPLARAIEAVAGPAHHKIFLTPDGTPFNQKTAERLSKKPKLLLLCGHYEGIDERVRETLVDEDISLGDFVLTGGELPALCLIDAVARLVPGVLGNRDSLRQESFEGGALDHPHYTRPRVFRGRTVPDILVSGDHKQVEAWRGKQAEARTQARRPDLKTFS